MLSGTRAFILPGLLALSLLAGCNNTLNPLCGSARPLPVIGSLSPSTIPFTQIQSGATLTVNGSNFDASSEVVINDTPLSATVVSAQKMQVNLTTSVISGPGTVKVKVTTPAGNSGNLNCTSGGNSSTLTLTVD